MIRHRPKRAGGSGALVRCAFWSALILAAAAVAPGAASAQSGALTRIEALVAAGDIEAARQTLESWWDASRSSANRSEIQHAYYLRARLATDAHSAELDYRRLVVEFPGGTYSDEALLRLASAAHARGDLVEAAAQFRALLRDYPSSPHRIRAQDWLERFGSAAARAREGADSTPRSAEAEAQAPVPATPPVTSGQGEEVTEARPESEREPEAEAANDQPYAVQLGAFASEDRAWRLADRARSAGLNPRLARIPGSSLLRVRIGHFPDSPSAEQILREVRRLGFEATIVTDAPEEVPVR